MDWSSSAVQRLLEDYENKKAGVQTYQQLKDKLFEATGVHTSLSAISRRVRGISTGKPEGGRPRKRDSAASSRSSKQAKKSSKLEEEESVGKVSLTPPTTTDLPPDPPSGLSNRLTESILLVPDDKGLVRKYLRSGTSKDGRTSWFRCSRCNMLKQKHKIAFKEGHDSLVEQAVEEDENLRGPSSLPALFPSWDRVRQQYSRLSKAAHPRICNPYELPPQYMVSAREKKRWYLPTSKEKKIVVFATDEMLELAANSEILVADATFKTCPKGFYQFYSLHSPVFNDLGQKRWVVVAAALMESKTTRSYQEFFVAIQNRWRELGCNLHFQHILTDFELGEMKAIENVFGKDKKFLSGNPSTVEQWQESIDFLRRCAYLLADFDKKGASRKTWKKQKVTSKVGSSSESGFKEQQRAAADISKTPKLNWWNLTEEQENHMKLVLNSDLTQSLRELVPAEQATIQFNYNLTLDRVNRDLDPGVWLTDEVIDAYMNLIESRSLEPDQILVRCFSVFLIASLRSRRTSVSSRHKIDFQQHQWALFPVNIRQNHWVVIAADTRKREIIYLDSLGGNNDQEILNLISGFLVSCEKECGLMSLPDYTVGHRDIPRQKNGFDCGVFMCQFAECISRNSPFHFTQKEMVEFRRAMKYELITLRLLPREKPGDTDQQQTEQGDLGSEETERNASESHGEVDHTNQLWQWYLENQQEFQNPIYVPIFSMSSEDLKFVREEVHVMEDDLEMFICTGNEDNSRLLKQMFAMGLQANLGVSPDVADVSAPDLARLQVIDVPEEIRLYLAGVIPPPPKKDDDDEDE